MTAAQWRAMAALRALLVEHEAPRYSPTAVRAAQWAQAKQAFQDVMAEVDALLCELKRKGESA